MRYIVYNIITHIIQRGGTCNLNSFKIKAHANEAVMEGIANDATQKIKFDSLDDDGQPVNPRVVDKTPEEIEAEKPSEISFEKQIANVTNEQWQNILDRLEVLENER